MEGWFGDARRLGERLMSEGFDLDADVRTRAAWLYYMEGLTQDAVAQSLGMTRARVLRMLASCREDGTVQIWRRC